MCQVRYKFETEWKRIIGAKEVENGAGLVTDETHIEGKRKKVHDDITDFAAKVPLIAGWLMGHALWYGENGKTFLT